jgi:hypothetical protein
MSDPLDIVNEFMTYKIEFGACPIDINNHYWLKKLCALAERCADAETALEIISTKSLKYHWLPQMSGIRGIAQKVLNKWNMK